MTEPQTVQTLPGIGRPGAQAKRSHSPRKDLARRAASALGGTAAEPHWPYGIGIVERWQMARRDMTDDEYERYIAQQLGKQASLMAWVEQHGLKQASRACCVRWLLQDRDRACKRPCDGPRGPKGLSLDHMSAWTKDGHPAVVVNAPYSIRGTTARWLADRLDRDDRLRGAMTPAEGWYGHGTGQVLFWRSDVIRLVGLPVPPLDGGSGSTVRPG